MAISIFQTEYYNNAVRYIYIASTIVVVSITCRQTEQKKYHSTSSDIQQAMLHPSIILLLLLLILSVSLTLCVAVESTSSTTTVQRYDEYTDTQRGKMKSDFKTLASNNHAPSWGCSDFGHIFSALRDADPSGDKVFIDIGFNKGCAIHIYNLYALSIL